MCRFEEQLIGRDLVLYDNETGSLHTLNETAVMVRRALQAGMKEKEILDSLTTKYPNVPAKTLADDLEGILNHFQRLGIYPTTS